MDSAFVEEPIQLISFNEEGKIEVNPLALRILREIPKPISVIGVAGSYRTGKSFLLNRIILNRKTGFHVGNTINPCTKGIWMWGKPIQSLGLGGQIVNTVVMDSEGLSAIDVDNNHLSRVFSLVMLLSSVFIYNHLGPIDEDSIENISYISKLTNNLHLQQGNNDVSIQDYQKYMPKFIWLLRDFSLELRDTNGNPITTQQYLQSALEEQEEYTQLQENKNRIRRVIRECFGDRQCVAFVRPMIDETDLRNLQQFELESLWPEFIQQALDFRKRVFNETKIKTLGDQVLDGELFAMLIQQYVSTINTEQIPVIQNTWNYICKEYNQDQVQKWLKKAEELLSDFIQTNGCVEDQQYKDYYFNIKDDIFQELQVELREDEDKSFEQFFLNQLKNVFKKFKQINRQNFQKDFEKNILEYFDQGINEKLKKNQYHGVLEYERDIIQLQNRFIWQINQSKNGKQILQEVLMNKIINGFYEIFQAFEKKNENEQVDKNKTINEMEIKIQQLLQEQKATTTKMDDEISQMKSLLNSKDIEIQSIKDLLESEKKIYEEKIETKNQQQNYLFQQEQKRYEELQSQFQSLQEQMESIQNESQMKQSMIGQNLEIQQNKIEQLEHLLQQKDQRIKEEHEQHEQQFQELQSQIESQNNEKNEEINKLSEENSQYQNRIQELINDTKNFELQQDIQLQAKVKEINQLNLKLQKTQKEQEEMQEKLDNIQTSQDNSQVQQLNEQISSLQQSKIEIEEILQKTKEDLSSAKNKYNADKSVHEQEIFFMKTQIEQLNNKIAELQNESKVLLELAQNNQNNNTPEVAQQIEQVRAQYESQIEELEKKYRNEWESFQKEISQLQEIKNNAQEQLQQQVQQNESNLNWIKNELLDKEKAIQRLETDFQKQKEAYKVQEMKDRLHIQNITEIHEKEIEELRIKNKQRQEEIQSQYESQLQISQLIGQEEKNKQEKQIKELKECHQKELNRLSEECAQQFAEEKDDLEYSLQQLQEESMAYRIETEKVLKGMANEISIFEKEKELSEQQIKKLQNEYDYLEQKYNTNVKELSQKMEKENKNLNEKVEKMTVAIQQNAQEIWRLQQTKQRLESDLEKEHLENENKEKTLKSFKENEKIERENLRERYKLQIDSLNLSKMENEKQIAVTEQKLSHQIKLNEELKRNFIELKNKHEQKLKNLNEKHDESQRLLKTKSKETLLSKQKEQEQKDSVIQSKIIELQQSAQATLHQIDTLHQQNSKYLEKIENLKKQNESLSNQIQRQEEAAETKYFNYKKEAQQSIEILKSQREFEIDQKNSIQAEYDKDLRLWSQKLNFVEEQYKRVQEELQQQKQKQEFLMEKLKLNSKAENNDYISSLIFKLEQSQKLKQKEIQEIRDRYEKDIDELKIQIQQQEKEHRKNIDSQYHERQQLQETLRQTVQQLQEYWNKDEEYWSKIDSQWIEEEQRFQSDKKWVEEKLKQKQMALKETEDVLSKLRQEVVLLKFQKENVERQLCIEKDLMESKITEKASENQRLGERIRDLQKEIETLKKQKSSWYWNLFDKSDFITSNLIKCQSTNESQNRSMNPYYNTRIKDIMGPFELNIKQVSDSKSQSQDDDRILNNFSKTSDKKVHFNQTVMSYELADK